MNQAELEKKVGSVGAGGVIFAVATSSIASELLAEQSTAIRLGGVAAWGALVALAWYFIARAIVVSRAKKDDESD